MAGASVDDIFVIILFTSFMGIYQGGVFNASTLLKAPVSIFVGLLVGVASGFVLVGVAGVTAGNTILTVAVLAILISAPIGAIGVDQSYRKLLVRQK